MNKKPKPILFDEWVGEIFKPVQERPKDAFTIEDVMAKTGRSKSHISNVLKAKVKRGELVMGKFKQGNGVFNYYQIVKDK